MIRARPWAVSLVALRDPRTIGHQTSDVQCLRRVDSRGARRDPARAVMTSNESRPILLHPDDDVVVMGADTPNGTPVTVDGTSVITGADVPAGHKVALRAIAPDEPVRKYGEVIGYAVEAIRAGDHVHLHNLGYRPIALGRELPASRTAPQRPVADRTFDGFRRRNGKAGTRNMIGLLTTVNCSASVARFIAAEVEKRGLLRDYPTIDGIVALTHTSGCAMR